MANSVDFRVLGAFLALALAIGGAGLAFPGLQMFLNLSALALAAWFVVTRRSWSFPPLTNVALALVGAMILLPLLQLVPLPPSVWTALPGRELPADVDSALGVSRWRPLTLDVEATIRALLALVPAVVLFVAALFLSRKQRFKLLWVVVAFAGVSAIFGIVQMATGGWLTPYPSGHSGYPIGLFVNRNHNAALLLAAMPLAAALGAKAMVPGRPHMPLVVASLSVILLFAMVAIGTTSRMALILLPLSLLASLAIMLYRRTTSRLAIASAVAVGAVVTFLSATGRFDRIVSRFTGLDDLRLNFWTDVQWALGHYGLAGTGIGTFIPVYKSAQSLDAVGLRVINHAHNDFLEILLDGGIVAIALVAAGLGLIAFAAVRAVRTRKKPGDLAVTGAVSVAIVVLLGASLVDYPLRMPAIAAVFALLCALLMPSPMRPHSDGTEVAVLSPGGGSRFPARMLGLAAIVPVLVLVLEAGMSAVHLTGGRAAAALGWASWSTQAHERQATQALVGRDLATALRHGNAAIALSPISVPGIRTVGLVRISQGAVGQGTSLMQSALVLGWLDPLTQLWAIEAAKTSGEAEKAYQRSEALFRQNVVVGTALAQLLEPPVHRDMVPLLADSLAKRPYWRIDFFRSAADLPSESANSWLRLVELLERTDAPVSLREGLPSLNALRDSRRMDEAQRLWAMLQDGDELLANGSFEKVDSPRGQAFPAYWQLPDRNRALVKVKPIDSSRPGRALHVRSTENPTVIWQTLMLRPGSYRFSFLARAEGDTGSTARWELRCGTAGAVQDVEVTASPTSGWRRHGSVFTVPNQNCPIQRLALKRSRDQTLQDLWLDEIRLEPMAR